MIRFAITLFTICGSGVFLAGCDKPVKITCETMDFSDCQTDIVTYDSTKADRKVLIIGVDGFRADAMQASISPFLHQLSQSPNVYYTDMNSIEDYTFSGPNWASLVTGVHWCKHQVVDNDYSNNNLDQTPHFFHWLERANSNLNTVSYTNWTPINEFSTIPHADVAPIDGSNDLDIFNLAVSALDNQLPLEPSVLFLHFDELDGAGHGHGYHPDVPEYAATLNTIDGYIAQLHNIIETKRGNGEEWMVCVVTDHGGEGTGHSGGQDDENISKTIFFTDCPEVNFSSKISEQVDLVPTVMEYLGVSSTKVECYKDGESLIQ